MIDPLQKELLDRFQRGFPLSPCPFAVIAEEMGLTEDAVLAHYRELKRQGALSRIGAVVRPGRTGASTLAATAAEDDELARIAARISEFPGVNHNYEREDALNLWFVVHAASNDALEETLAQMERAIERPIFSFPMEKSYHLDTGFAL
ncbi:Siroheme decarboxylase [Sulfidibacter corallicola]|uniref:siroheme decarboxylase n=1 Tax=Sulfidibacter corallicola TaxID=2818388 RepID=A0A8A4TLD4_SULCO|nr:Lrp/AsnC family transcriptional regulator [Sulfidibacter corallicola]QTD50383.1 hypothetical protein J3U87_32765 [Sulfidibacter corallicola]